MSQTARIATTVAATATVLAGSYALYFDYQRRNNPEFRKSIRLQKKKAQAQEEGEKKALKAKLDRDLRAALANIQNEPTPQSPEQQEAFFQECVAEGEKLAVMGPEKQVESAMHFFRALRVYPNPVELLMIYQKVVPPQVFELVVQAMQLAPGGAAGPGASAGRGGLPLGVGTGMPAPVDASVSDIDESSSSPIGAGVGGSEADWDRLSRE